MSANKDTSKKPQAAFLHPETLKQLSLAHQAGTVKYGRLNYVLGHSETALVEAIIRHAYAYLWVSEYDSELTEILRGQSVSHLGAILANVNMLLTQKALGTIKHDIPRVEVANILTKKEDK